MNIKQELSTLDRNDFMAVCDLADSIINDIWTTSLQENHPEWREELKMDMIKDYIIDLINPDLLDFDE